VAERPMSGSITSLEAYEEIVFTLSEYFSHRPVYPLLSVKNKKAQLDNGGEFSLRMKRREFSNKCTLMWI
jgi:hypothetical protein